MPVDNAIAESAEYLYGSNFTNPNDRYSRNWKALDRQFDVWKDLYVDVADYIAIGRGRFIDRGELPNQRTRAAKKVINATATDALHMLGSGLHGGLSSPARPWFQLQFSEPSLNKFRLAREWLDDCETIMYAHMKRSNFYGVVHLVYEEIAAFGTGSLLVDAVPAGLLFRYFTAGDYRFVVDDSNMTAQWYRKFRMQACNVLQLFGEKNITDKVKNLLRSNPYEWVNIIHVIEPNPNHNPDKLDSKPFHSIYFEANENEQRLSASGYYEMPAVTPRWQALSNESYGWGPGLDALGLAKSIQRKERQKFLASDKSIDPPLAVPPSMKDRMLDLSPGAKNIYEPREGEPRPLVKTDLRALAYFDNSIDRLEARIRSMFFNDLFLIISQKDTRMTATEVLARNEEKMLMIGPVIERLEYEFLDPIVARVFSILMRQGRLPAPPADIRSAEYEIEYISVLAQAQKLVNQQTMDSYLLTAERVANLDQQSLIKTDWNKFLEEKAEVVSLPAKLLRSDDEVEQILAAEQQRQAQFEQLARTEAEYGNLKTLSEAKTAGNSNALADLTQSLEAA